MMLPSVTGQIVASCDLTSSYAVPASQEEVVPTTAVSGPSASTPTQHTPPAAQQNKSPVAARSAVAAEAAQPAGQGAIVVRAQSAG